MTNQEKALWVAVKRLERRLGIAAGGVTPNVHATNHGAGSTDPIDILDLDGYPNASPATAFLREDGAWATPAGAGDVSGPGASTDKGIARYDGVLGDALDDTSGPTLEDDGRIANLTDPTGAQDAATKAYVDSGAGLWPDYTPPVDGDFAWINQGGASITATTVQGAAGLFLIAPANAAENIRLRKKAAPATPYSITAAILTRLPGAVNNNDHCGIAFRQSSDGKLALWCMTPTQTLRSFKYTSPTVFSATYSTSITFMRESQALIWLRITDDGTNRICSVSSDGKNFQVIHSVGRTDFLTADEVGFYCNSKNNLGDVGATLLSWEEA